MAMDQTGPDNPLTRTQREYLLKSARKAVETFLEEGRLEIPRPDDPQLMVERGAFVTLRQREKLQGCIGLLKPRYSLLETVCRMAVEAAVGDPRFPAVTLETLPRLTIEISVLTPLRRVQNPNEINIPGDGVLVIKGECQGVFLPQVALETGWNREEFLTRLCGHKAGLAPDAWKQPGTELYRFRAEAFSEESEAISASR